ncbi:MAG: autotransporter outer membrane beta-barrel domain-containing protein [Deltaproteobacteria bacterium]|nr:autotransporter outer membrane beta-barrel domain-containing protein [Deltaproteobacteria bacterium]
MPAANGFSTTVATKGFNQQAKAISELPLADVSFLNRGSDDIASDAIPSAVAAVSGAHGLSAFASLGYGKERIATGSHVEVKGLTGNIGVAIGAETGAGIALAGLFLEFGRGEFDSFNSFADSPSVNGNGDVTYLGGGILGRFEIGGSDKSRPYVEASARLGRSKSDFNSRDYGITEGANATLNLHSRYYGLHAGGGYILNFQAFEHDGSMDFSGKLFYTRQNGHEMSFLGEHVYLSPVTSVRFRAGARVNIGLTESVRPFVGGYFEREFDGESRITIGDTRLPKVSLEGNTGIGELGLSMTSAAVPLTFEVGLQGSGGKRDGIQGAMKVNYTF